MHVDAAILGVSELYASQRAGIWRFVRDWLNSLRNRPDLDISLVSCGRGIWNELALETALATNRFDMEGFRFLQRPGRLPGIRNGLGAVTRWLFALRHHRILNTTGVLGGMLLCQAGLQRKLCQVTRGIYHSPFHPLPELPLEVSRTLTVHDMIPVLFPEWFGSTKHFRASLDSLDPTRDHVVADSNSTRNDFLRLTGFPSSQVHVAQPGISSRFQRLDRDQAQAKMRELGIPKRFILSVGTLEPRKNLSMLLKAFRKIAERPGFEEVHLVLTGARGWKNAGFDQTLSELGSVRQRVLVTGFLPDEILQCMYAASEVFVFPSLYEGFGFPILEAMACGAAVVAMNNSSQPEVAGEAALLCAEATADAIAENISMVLQSSELQQRLRSAGYERVKLFSWTECAQTYASIWQGMTELKKRS